jgi:hypothetical protein
MPITFQCPNPNCKKRMSVKDELAGKKGLCPACKQSIVVPAASSAAEAAPKPQPAAAAPATASEPTAAKATPAAPPAPKPSKPRAAIPPKTNGDAKAAPTPRKSQAVPAASGNGSAAPGNGESSAPPVDADSEAAAFFSDVPKKEDETPTSIKFSCEWCDFAMEVSSDMAGKRTPCPDCRRITKIPELVKAAKKDWLKNAQPEAAPEGASGTGKGATMVSEEALEAAGAIADEPRTLKEKIYRGLAAAVVLALVGWGAMSTYGWWSGRKETAAYVTLTTYAKSDGAVKAVGHEGVAALYVAAGDYQRRTRIGGTPPDGCAKRAKEQFQQALGHLGEAKSGAERDAVLLDLAQAQVELGGNSEEIEKGTRLKWDAVQGDVAATLTAINNEEARLLALRGVCRRLIALGQAERALPLAFAAFADGRDIPKTEAVAAIGLELFTAGKKSLAENAAAQALTAGEVVTRPPPPGDGAEPPPEVKVQRIDITPSVSALSKVLGQPTEGFDAAPDTAEMVGTAEASARNGDWDNAKKTAASLENAEYRLRALVAVASVGPGGKASLEEAIKLANSPQNFNAWVLLRLLDLGARAGIADDQLEAVAKRITHEDPSVSSSLRARGQLLAFKAKLAASKGAGDDKAIEAIDSKSLSAMLAKQALAQHNTRLDSGFAKTVQTWDDPAKAFGAAGALLGLRPGDEEEKKK